jgi:hypothetical protein
MQPVLIQQPDGQLQQVYIQQQPAFATLTQAPQQQQQQQQPQQAARMLRGALGTPSPTPVVLGRAGTPLSSSPSPGLNPLVVMAAAGAARDAARREGSGSSATSPRYTSSMFVTGARHGHHSRSSSHGGSHEVPPLHLLQLSDMQAGSPSGSPQRTPGRSDRMSSDGGVAYSHNSFSNGPPVQQQAAGQGQAMPPGTMVVSTAGPAVVAPLLLQRLSSLHRSGSSGCSPRCLHRSSSPGRPSTDQSGPLMGLLVPGYGPGPSSGPSSPRSHSPRHERHVHTPPAAVAAVHHLHRPGSSRLAIQGSYELPPGAAAAASGDLQQATSPAGATVQYAGSGCGAGLTDPGQAVPVYGSSVLHAQPAHVFHHQFPQALPAVLQTSGRRAPSLLRIDSNSRDRAISPFAMASAAMGSDHGSHEGSTGGGMPWGAGVPVAAAPAGTCSRTLSPFAAASSGGSSLEDVAAGGSSNNVVQVLDPTAATPAPAAVAAPGGAAGYSSCRPPAPVRYVSPFAAAAGRQEDDGDTDIVFDTSVGRNSRSASPAPGAGVKQQTGQVSGAFKGAAAGTGSASGAGSTAPGAGGSRVTRLASPFALMQQQESAAERD